MWVKSFNLISWKAQSFKNAILFIPLTTTTNYYWHKKYFHHHHHHNYEYHSYYGYNHPDHHHIHICQDVCSAAWQWHAPYIICTTFKGFEVAFKIFFLSKYYFLIFICTIYNLHHFRRHRSCLKILLFFSLQNIIFFIVICTIDNFRFVPLSKILKLLLFSSSRSLWPWGWYHDNDWSSS